MLLMWRLVTGEGRGCIHFLNDVLVDENYRTHCFDGQPTDLSTTDIVFFVVSFMKLVFVFFCGAVNLRLISLNGFKSNCNQWTQVSKNNYNSRKFTGEKMTTNGLRGVQIEYIQKHGRLIQITYMISFFWMFISRF